MFEATKKKKGGIVIVAIAAAILLLLALSKKKNGGGVPPPANPVVNVGDDQAVTLDATSHAEVTVNFTVTADNPVNLTWTNPSGPAPAAFSIVGPGQERVSFTTPGNYVIRLTATDTTNSSAQGFDEMIVAVNATSEAAVLVPGQLTVDGFASYTLTRDQGDTVSFVWPVENVGNLEGAAFIQLTEGGFDAGTGAPFPIGIGRTVGVEFNPVITLPLGVHTLIARVMEGLPPAGVPIGASQTITLTVVSIPILAAVGDPTIDGILGATTVFRRPSAVAQTIPISWGCQNSGGGAGRARLLIDNFGSGVPLVLIPGFTTVTLLSGVTGRFASVGQLTFGITMVDEFGVILGSWQFTLVIRL